MDYICNNGIKEIMNKILLLIPLFMIVLILGVPYVEADKNDERHAKNWKYVSQDNIITLNSNGDGSLTDIIYQCGQTFHYTYYINGNTNFVSYEWLSTEEMTCDGKQWEFHHVYLEVWERKADNVRDLHEMFSSSSLESTREYKDYSRLIDPFDTLGLHTAFVFTEK